MSQPHDPNRLPPAGRPAQYGGHDRYGEPGLFAHPRDAGPRPRSAGHTEPQPYHKLLLTPNYAWWRPLIGLGVFGVTFVALTLAVTIGIVAADTGRTGGTVADSFERFGAEMDPLFLLGTNLSLAVAIPAAALAIVLAHRMRPGWLSSVIGRLRWGLLLRMTGLALVVVVAFTFLGGWITDDGEGPTVDEIEIVSLSTWLTFAVVIVLTTPLQAAAEEYAFRG
ncbi:MAG TPA: hypothetical protein VK925_12540, partial [Jiangellaceae bacterium]|nr:hypothetical protein [Jiangellaceae bacterium]